MGLVALVFAASLALSPSEGPPGVAVRASGVAATSTRDVVVRALGRELRLLEAGADWVRFAVPVDAPLGKLEVEVSVKGSVSRAIYTVKPGRDERTDGDQPLPPDTIHDVTLAIRGSRVVVTGATSLPDHAFVSVAFGSASGDEKVLTTAKVDVRARAFHVELALEADLAPGRYFTEVTFDLARQSALAKSEKRPPETAWAKAFATVGTAREIEVGKKAREEHYAALARRLADLRAAIERAKDVESLAKIAAALRDEEERDAAFEKRSFGARDERAANAAKEALRAVRQLVFERRERH